MERNRIIATVSILISIFTFVNCTPYNSDKVNTDLIQGKWLLIEADRSVYDTVEVDYTKDLTYLIFEEDRCRQYMSDWKDTMEFIYTIHNYELTLYKDSIPFRMLDIKTLTSDSLVLSFKDDKWEYKKLEQ
ncbi:hypothetical protein JGH11_13710 [Dysgonomonas sp. Marseille-P4677]|uniref:hypothetical protein n=1 Tax=Dysgonomonas sp. Marseille-P4677 TaxID=2364790 RepID=UPI001913256E|nr:hypothetical protein [Dysgonomonas sp. Marseille-P4677]MBK5721931.1 hypothetical protein [Dysgonomonas sp. Marseille-P4677]